MSIDVATRRLKVGLAFHISLKPSTEHSSRARNGQKMRQIALPIVSRILEASERIAPLIAYSIR